MIWIFKQEVLKRPAVARQAYHIALGHRELVRTGINHYPVALLVILFLTDAAGQIIAEAGHVAVDRHCAVGVLDIDGVAVTHRRYRQTADISAFDGMQLVAAAGVGAPVQPGVEVIAAQLSVSA